MITVFDQGFKSDGGIGGYIRDWSTDNDIDYARFAFDNAYNIVIMIIMLNIV